MHHFGKLTLLVFLAGLLLAGTTMGQGHGTISGTVTDPSGGRIPGVTVTATDMETGAVATSLSSDEGLFRFVRLRPGVYVVEAELTGFKRLSRPNVKVDVAGHVTLDLRLEVGEISETVSVSSEIPQLRTEDAQTGEVINLTMLRNLPQLDRNPLTLLRLSGLVSGGGVAGSGDYADLRISGGRTTVVDYNVDGTNINTGRAHNVPAAATPTMESVSEFKVITGGMAAEYGRSSGGIVEVVTKTGTNEFHGELFEYFRNELLNANTWFQNATGGQRLVYKQNIFGGAVGGPVWIPKVYNGRNKTFWFFNYQGTRYREAAANRVASVPTEAERNGDMSATLFNGVQPEMWNPFGTITGSGEDRWKTELLGGDGLRVPANMIHPMSKAILKHIPMPNQPSTPGFSQRNNYISQQSTSSNADYWALRVDHNFTDRHRLTGRLTRDKWNRLASQWLGPLNPPIGQAREGSFVANLSYDFTVSPTLLFNARVGGMHDPNDGGPQWTGYDTNEFPYDPEVKKWVSSDRLPFSTIIESNGGWGGTRLVNVDQPHSGVTANNNFNAVASVSKIWNKHTVKTGLEHRRYYDNFLETGLGWLSFNGTATMREAFGGGWLEPNQDKLRANAWGDFLLGMPNFTQQSGPWTLALNFNYWAAYVQDDWKMTPNLTLNLGLRWDTETPVTERNEKLVAWDPDAPSFFAIPSDWNWAGALRAAGLTDSEIAMFPEPEWSKNRRYPNGSQAVAGTSDYPDRALQKHQWKNFAPRLGMAYRVNDKTTLRASTNVMYFSSSGSYYSMWTVVVPGTSATGPWDELDPATGIRTHSWDRLFGTKDYSYYKHTMQEANFQVGGNMGGPTYTVNNTTPHEYVWNLTLQRQITPNLIAEATYLGNYSSTLPVRDRLNPFPKQYLKPELGPLLSKQVQNPVAGQIMSNPASFTSDTVPLGILLTSNPSRGYLLVNGVNEGKSMFNGVNLRVERRMSRGYAFLVNYTVSKALDNTGGPNMSAWGAGSFAKGTQVTDTFRDAYGYSPLDHTHRLVWYHDVELPIGKGRRFLSNPQDIGSRILDRIVGGWELAGNAIYTSGTPFSFGTSGGVSSQAQGAPGLAGFIYGQPDELSRPGFSKPEQVLRGPRDTIVQGEGRFDSSKFGLPELLTYGSMPPIYPWIRNPGRMNYDLSLMKNVYLSENTFLQMRLEAENAFNIRGLGNYNTTFGDRNFGYITSAGNSPRRMQLSARIIF
jgi:outer membrane receptor protein involved in Fe transport